MCFAIGSQHLWCRGWGAWGATNQSMSGIQHKRVSTALYVYLDLGKLGGERLPERIEDHEAALEDSCIVRVPG